jgi:hypothetical protein
VDTRFLTVVLALAVLAALIVVSRFIGVWLRRLWGPNPAEAERLIHHETLLLWRRMNKERDSRPVDAKAAEEELFEKGYATLSEYLKVSNRRIARVGLVLNIATTILGIIPLALAIYSLLTDQAQQAFRYSLVSLAALALKVALIPIIQGAFSFIGGLIAKRVYNRVTGKKPDQTAGTA